MYSETIRKLFALFAFSAGLLLAIGVSAQAQKKKKGSDTEITQTLPALPEPPGAISAETGRLVFHVSPLSSKGLLSQQVRDALKEMLRDRRGAPVVKIRAFVAGSGDLRRVSSIVSEIFAEHKLALPVLTTIQAGALPLEGAQVALESVEEEKKTVNPQGLAFFSGQQNKNVSQAVIQLQAAVNAAQVQPQSVLRATCFLSSLDDVQAARTAVANAFPAAAADYIQLQREAVEPLAECEAVGRLDTPPASSVVFLNPPGLSRNPNYSQIALVNAPKIVFSGAQMAFGDQDSDIRLALGRLQKALEAHGVTYKDVFWSSTYPLTRPVADKVRSIRFDFFDHSLPPASTMLIFEGLPSLDASAAFEVAAAASN